MVEEYLIGVDEAGRGPLAGPVAVGVVAVPAGFDILREFPGVTDSKMLSRQKRELIFIEVERRASRGDLQFVVEFSDQRYIDRFGITKAVQTAAWSGVRSLSGPAYCTVLLDGLLRAPEPYTQRTLVRGDARSPVIGLASILAKVTRDRTMEQVSALYPEYGFEAHKGYGTQEHVRAIKRHGMCPMHRKTFCRNLGASLALQS